MNKKIEFLLLYEYIDFVHLVNDLCMNAKGFFMEFPLFIKIWDTLADKVGRQVKPARRVGAVTGIRGGT